MYFPKHYGAFVFKYYQFLFEYYISLPAKKISIIHKIVSVFPTNNNRWDLNLIIYEAIYL